MPGRSAQITATVPGASLVPSQRRAFGRRLPRRRISSIWVVARERHAPGSTLWQYRSAQWRLTRVDSWLPGAAGSGVGAVLMAFPFWRKAAAVSLVMKSPREGRGGLS